MAATESTSASAPAPVSDERAALQIAVGNNDAAANLLLVWRKAQSDYKLFRVQAEQKLTKDFLALARDAAKNLVERQLIPYDPEWPLKSHEFFALPNDPPAGGNLFEELADFTNLPWFKKDDLTKPSLYVVAVSTNAGVAFFGKRMAQLRVLSRKNKLLNLTWDGSTFHELETSVATFSRNFDWVVWASAKGTMYVLDSVQFHAEFRDLEALRNAVEGHVLELREKIEIRNFEQMILRCQRSVPMASKLKHVAEHGIADRPVAELKKYGAERAIEITWEGDALVFEPTLERQWNVLKLLDEDRTVGPVTGRTYESSAKRQVKP
jgi:hypothetical protein